MKVLVLVVVMVCFLDSAVLKPIEGSSEEFMEFLNNCTIDEHSLFEDGVEPKVRQRRNADVPPESCQCKREDFYISWKEMGLEEFIIHPLRLNLGACIGGPVVIGDSHKGKSHFEVIMQMRKKLLITKSDDDKKSTTGTTLMQFKHEVENSELGNSLSYEFLPACQATLKPVPIITKDKRSITRTVSLPDLAIDSCTCI